MAGLVSLLIALLLFLVGGSSYAAPEDFVDTDEFTLQMSMACFTDRALWRSAGQESQCAMLDAKLTYVMSSGSYGMMIEPAYARQTVYTGKGLEYDYYKNKGTSILYYGNDMPFEDLYVFWRPNDAMMVRIGRQVNIAGIDWDDYLYHTRHDAPHAVVLQKELLTGFSLDWYPRSDLFLQLGIYGGNGRPGADGNYGYGPADFGPNQKGNNTPVLEAKVTWSATDNLNLYWWGHRNKRGSAVGTIAMGKHNDNHTGFGLRYDSCANSRKGWCLELEGQVASYLVGLTEDGVQGTATPLASYDIRKDSTFGTVRLSRGYWFGQYTYEQLDRADAPLWEAVGFNPHAPLMRSIERSHALVLGWSNSDWMAALFYRTIDNPAEFLSDIDPLEGSDKGGLYIGLRF